MTLGRAKDIASIRQLEKDWCEGWNKHDMRLLTNLLTKDVDFVTVGGRWLRGRKEFKEHTGTYHDTSFKHSVFDVTATTIKFINPNLALAHVKWRLSGDFDPDGTPRKPRKGIFTQVLLKTSNRWQILASHNTNMAVSFKKVRRQLSQHHWK